MTQEEYDKKVAEYYETNTEQQIELEVQILIEELKKKKADKKLLEEKSKTENIKHFDLRYKFQGNTKFIKVVDSINDKFRNGYSIVGDFVNGDMFNIEKVYFVVTTKTKSDKCTYMYYYLLYYNQFDECFQVEEVERNVQMKTKNGKSFLKNTDAFETIWDAIYRVIADYCLPKLERCN